MQTVAQTTNIKEGNTKEVIQWDVQTVHAK